MEHEWQRGGKGERREGDREVGECEGAGSGFAGVPRAGSGWGVVLERIYFHGSRKSDDWKGQTEEWDEAIRGDVLVGWFVIEVHRFQRTLPWFRTRDLLYELVLLAS